MSQEWPLQKIGCIHSVWMFPVQGSNLCHSILNFLSIEITQYGRIEEMDLTFSQKTTELRLNAEQPSTKWTENFQKMYLTPEDKEKMVGGVITQYKQPHTHWVGSP